MKVRACKLTAATIAVQSEGGAVPAPRCFLRSRLSFSMSYRRKSRGVYLFTGSAALRVPSFPAKTTGEAVWSNSSRCNTLESDGEWRGGRHTATYRPR